MSIFKKHIIILVILSSMAGSASALPSFNEVRKSYKKSDTMILDRNGRPLYELRTNRQIRRLGWTALRDISPALLLAVVFAEDKRFFEHSGVDYLSIGAALIGGIDRDSLRGASTITMQLASLLNEELRPSRGRRTILQKWEQIKEANKLEKQWNKREILEAYLNMISFRGELQGINAASRGLYGKAPHGLNQPEALILASLIRSPNASSGDIYKRAMLLKKILNWQIKKSEIKAAIQPVLGPASPDPASDIAPHAARFILKRISALKGKRVKCTIDAGLQRFALERLTNQLGTLGSQNVTNGAVLAIDNKTGEVLAYVSSTSDPERDRYVDGVQAKRQAGSTLKPFLYALAFEKKILTPASILEDAPIDMPVSSGIYHPNNYEGDFKGLVTARSALASSLNIPAVRTLSLVGEELFLSRLRSLEISGITESGAYYGPSMALGSIDVSLWELTNAYRCLANGGILSKPGFIFKSKNSRYTKRVFSLESAFIVSDILSDREARSLTFGLENPLATQIPDAVKTGTSKDMRDNWCVGYSHKYTVGVWVGNFSGEAMWDVSGISGAAPVWIEIMNRLHSGESKYIKQNSPAVTRKHISFSEEIEEPREEWFIKGTEPDKTSLKTGQLNQRIIYPPSGAILAIDPDIPQDLQKVFFISKPENSRTHWLLNDSPVDKIGGSASWSPVPGMHTLSLCDEEGHMIDTVKFEVRGGDSKQGSEKQ